MRRAASHDLPRRRSRGGAASALSSLLLSMLVVAGLGAMFLLAVF
jgi:hypothetical protein